MSPISSRKWQNDTNGTNGNVLLMLLMAKRNGNNVTNGTKKVENKVSAVFGGEKIS